MRRAKSRILSEAASCDSGEEVIEPTNQSGSTQWSQAYTSPLNSIAMFAPHTGACTHTDADPNIADSVESTS